MSRMTKIMVIAIGYGMLGLVVSLMFGTTAFFEENIVMEALAVAGIAFVFGFVENGLLGWGFFTKWLNAE